MSHIENEVRKLYAKFELERPEHPTFLPPKETSFRARRLLEELAEYFNATFIIEKDNDEAKLTEAVIALDNWIRLATPREECFASETPRILGEQLDALVDLVVYAVGTSDRQGLPFTDAFDLVMEANSQKKRGPKSSRDTLEIDLFKPPGWKEPDIAGLIANCNTAAVDKPTGIIVLEGPDGTGKTTLGEKLAKEYNGHYMHLTWSKEINERMSSYVLDNLYEAIQRSKNQLVIIDRLHISEVVYAEVFRTGSTLGGQFVSAVTEKLDEVGATTVFCVSDSLREYVKRYEKLLTEREEMYTSVPGMKYVASLFAVISKGKDVAWSDNHTPYNLVTKKNIQYDYTQYDFAFTEGCFLDLLMDLHTGQDK
jgi:predicted HAD superfamily Cof-like phosphohydrolase/nicotinamide riboside kinase